MENSTLLEKAQSLRRLIANRKEGGNKYTLIEVELLDEIFRGNAPVGGNEKPPEDVNEMLYDEKARRIRLEIELQDIQSELHQLADLMADSEDLRVSETPIVARLNAILEQPEGNNAKSS